MQTNRRLKWLLSPALLPAIVGLAILISVSLNLIGVPRPSSAILGFVFGAALLLFVPFQLERDWRMTFKLPDAGGQNTWESVAMRDISLEDVQRVVIEARASNSPGCFRACRLPEGLTFDEQSLRDYDFSKAILSKVDFTTSDLTGATFHDASLPESDLSLAKGLTVGQLSGADLTRCKLPDDVSSFPQLENIRELSKNAGALFLTMILACGFVLTTVVTTRDVQLLTGSGTARIPVVNVAVPTVVFFTVTPLILLGLFVVVQLYLQRLWEAMAALPAFFPDGDGIEFKTYPWLFNDLIRLTFPLLRARRGTLATVQTLLYSGLVYLAVPLTLAIIYLRCLARHDSLLSTLQTYCFTLSMVAIGYRAVHPLRGRNGKPSNRHVGLAIATLPWAGIVVISVGLVQLFDANTQNSLTGFPRDLSSLQRQLWQSKSIGGSQSPLLRLIDEADQRLVNVASGNPEVRKDIDDARENLESVRKGFVKVDQTISPIPIRFHSASIFPGFGNIEEDRSSRSSSWRDSGHIADIPMPTKEKVSPEDFKRIAKVSADHRTAVQNAAQEQRTRAALFTFSTNLRFLRARSAFLGNADFRGVTLTGADLSYVDLRGSLMREQNYESVIASDPAKPKEPSRSAALDFVCFRGADLSGACLDQVVMTGADLSNANLTGADLVRAVLTGSDLYGVKLAVADLNYALLQGTRLSTANLEGATLEHAKLTGSNLSDAVLTLANLEGARAEGADFQRAFLMGASLAGAYLSCADFDSAHISGANLHGAFLKGAILSGAELQSADLGGADLRGTVFGGAQLTNSDLRDANCQGANFDGADLTGANLSGADLSGVVYGSTTIWAIPSGYRSIPRVDFRSGKTRPNEYVLEFAMPNSKLPGTQQGKPTSR